MYIVSTGTCPAATEPSNWSTTKFAQATGRDVPLAFAFLLVRSGGDSVTTDGEKVAAFRVVLAATVVVLIGRGYFAFTIDSFPRALEWVWIGTCGVFLATASWSRGARDRARADLKATREPVDRV